MLVRMKWWILAWTLVAVLMILSGPVLLAQDGITAKADTNDDEIVVIGQDGKVYGLVFKPNELAVAFTSPDSGWTKVATGDFNGDGDHEIVAIGGTTVKVYDPGGSATPASFSATGPAGLSWRQVTTGDIDGDGQDEVVLIRDNNTDNRRGNVTIYSPTNAQATTWTQLSDEDFLTNWRDVAVGDIENNDKDDLALIFYQDPYNVFELREGLEPQKLLDNDPDATLTTLDQEWFDIVVGQIKAGGREEWAVTRSKGDTLLAQEWTGEIMSTFADKNFSPPFTQLALGDIYGDGDDEVVGLRHVTSGTGVQVWNPAGTQYTYVFGASIGTGWLGLAVGDVDSEISEGTRIYDEIILVKQDRIRIYLQAQDNTTFVEFSGTYQGAVATGNLNIEDIEPVALSATELNALEAVGNPLVPLDFTIQGETAPDTAINWQATIQSVPPGATVDWLKLTNLDTGNSIIGGGILTGMTPSTVRAEFITASTPLSSVGHYQATITLDLGPGINPQIRTIPVNVWIVAEVTRQYLPIAARSPTLITALGLNRPAEPAPEVALP
jgi:hypothetical protein